MANCDDFPGLYFPDSNGNLDFEKPCWNDDWEHELRNDGYKTVKEWNSVGRSIKKGEKGKYLPCAKVTVFSESQTITSNFSSKNIAASGTVDKYFETFEKAISWAKVNPGKKITRSPDGKGFIAKK